MDIILVLFVCPIVSFVVIIITIVMYFLLKKENKDIIEKAKKLDFVKRINKYTRILLIIFLVFLLFIAAYNIIYEYYSSYSSTLNESDILYGDIHMSPYTPDISFLYGSIITEIQLFIVVYVPTRVIASIILLKKTSNNKDLNENEKGIIKKYYTYKMIINICLGFIIFGAVSMIRFILSWAG